MTDDLLHLEVDRAGELRSGRMSDDEADAIATAAKAMADPTRVLMADALAEAKELCVADLAWLVERPANLVSHHVRLLKAAGIADKRQSGKLALYRLTPLGLAVLDAVAEHALAENG
jgi:DNA-binding transcriptional ArsR family regulator